MNRDIKAISINNGIEGLLEDLDIINFVDGLIVLNKFYSISLKALAEACGISYSTLRVMVALKENRLNVDTTIKAVTNLRNKYSNNLRCVEV